MNPTNATIVPKWYWIVCGLALLWNLIGCLMWCVEMFAQESMMTTMTEPQKEWVRSMPSWIYGVYAVAVSTGVAGSLGLLLRKHWARPVLIISLALVLIQMLYPTLIGGGLQAMGPQSLIMPVVVISIAGFLVWFASLATTRQWLRA